MFDCNLACVHFVSSSTGGYAIALVELIKLAFSVLNRLLARKEKVCLFRIMLLKCPPILPITFLQQFKRLLSQDYMYLGRNWLGVDIVNTSCHYGLM